MWAALSAAAISLVVASVERLVVPQLIGCVLLGMIGWSLLTVFRAPRLSVSVDLPERIVVAEPFEAAVRLVNDDRWSQRSLLVKHHFRAGHRFVPDGVGFVGRLPGHSETIVRLTSTPIARGAATGSDIEITINAPFGFFSRSITNRVARAVWSLPAEARALDVQAATARPVASSSSSAGVDMRGVRAWRAGDEVRDIAWRAMARSGRPTVLERDSAPSDCLVVVVMAAPSRRGRLRIDPDYERAISAVAATARAALRSGRSICLIAPGSALPVAGRLHANDERSVLDTLAALDVTNEPSAALIQHAMQHAGRGGTTLLVVHNSTPSAWRSPLLLAAAKAGVNTIDVRRMLAQTQRAGGSA